MPSQSEITQLANHWQQALLHHKQKSYEVAATHYQAILDVMPEHVDSLHYYALMLHEQNRDVEAYGIIKRALALDANSPEILSNFLAIVLDLEFNPDEKFVQEKAEMLVKLKPDWAEGIKNVCRIWVKYDKYDVAIKIAENLNKLVPDDVELLQLLGGMYFKEGDNNKAISYYEESIKLDKSLHKAFAKVCSIKKFKYHREDESYFHQAFIDSEPGSEERTYLGFALGKMYDDLGEYDKAFECYKLANENRMVEDDCSFFRKRYEKLVENFTPEFKQKFSACGSQSEKPVFILGMPRSGSTLSEQVLSSHTKVHAGGERDDIIDSFYALAGRDDNNWLEMEAHLNNLGCDSVIKMSENYLNIINEESPNSARFIDKMPNNFFNIGLIKIMFPNAKIIYTSRHPLDTILSCYFQSFSFGNLFSFNLDSMIEFYNIHDDVMKFWLSMYDDIFVLRYDDMVNETEATTRKLVDFLELAWDENCLLHHKKNDRVPRTGSHWQARQPVYKTSKNRWLNYEKYIKPYESKVQADVFINQK